MVEFSTFDPDAGGVEDVVGTPLRCAASGPARASAGETILATRALLGDQPSINRVYFNEAAGADDPDDALALWICCLEAGDAMGHFGIGYTLYELQRYQEAYRHLRHYTEIAPCGSWNWCWFGRAAEAVGELAEARRAYERAIELEAQDSYETDAADRLAKLAG